MNPTFKNILAVICGCIVGAIVNMGIIMISGYIIPPPEGVDVTNTENLIANIHLFEPKHFIMPFLAHALGTFAGAWLAAYMAASRKISMALIVGFLFLLGGIGAVRMIPAPMWYNVIDLVFAYIPMAYLAAKTVMTSYGPKS